MNQLRFFVSSKEETYQLGQLLGEHVKGGSIIGLSGELGAGKTELAKGVAQGLGITECIVSPTFVLEAIYNLPQTAFIQRRIQSFHHWDLYRLTADSVEGAGELALYDYGGDRSKVVIVEWPERFPWVENLLSVKIQIGFPKKMGIKQCFSEESREMVIAKVEDRELLRQLETFRSCSKTSGA